MTPFFVLIDLKKRTLLRMKIYNRFFINVVILAFFLLLLLFFFGPAANVTEGKRDGLGDNKNGARNVLRKSL